jgi:hypothetical protein
MFAVRGEGQFSIRNMTEMRIRTIEVAIFLPVANPDRKLFIEIRYTCDRILSLFAFKLRLQ